MAAGSQLERIDKWNSRNVSSVRRRRLCGGLPARGDAGRRARATCRRNVALGRLRRQPAGERYLEPDFRFSAAFETGKSSAFVAKLSTQNFVAAVRCCVAGSYEFTRERRGMPPPPGRLNGRAGATTFLDFFTNLPARGGEPLPPRHPNLKASSACIFRSMCRRKEVLLKAVLKRLLRDYDSLNVFGSDFTLRGYHSGSVAWSEHGNHIELHSRILDELRARAITHTPRRVIKLLNDLSSQAR